MILIREDQTYPDLRVHHMVRAASLFYPDWDAGLAATLLEAYELPATRPDRLTLQQLAIHAAGSHDRLDLTERETVR